jgi:histidyl-tRNA synthetase
VLKALGGTSDILPAEAAAWQRVETIARKVLHSYGYQEIRTPLIEEAAVFTGSLGEVAEIVTKQMYLFEDRGGRSVALRPEGTASVVRAFIEHGLDKTASVSRLYYTGPMFRAERPQAGRKRQFHQLGLELFGSSSPYQDAEVITLMTRLLDAWGVRGWVLKINSLGCKEDRPRIVEHVREKLQPNQEKLCADCKVRLEKNPLRILDCKEEGCVKLGAGVDVLAAICSACKEHFDAVIRSLGGLKIPFQRDPHLVRGLDYYSRTAFEVLHGNLGAQNALGGGGRYDTLVEQMGGVAVPAIGFAIGLERILMALNADASEPPADTMPQVYVAAVSTAQIPEALQMAEELRGQGVPVLVNLEERALKKQLEQAAKILPKGTVLILGEDEIRNNKVTVRDMNLGQQELVARDEIVQRLVQKAVGTGSN